VLPCGSLSSRHCISCLTGATTLSVPSIRAEASSIFCIGLLRMLRSSCNTPFITSRSLSRFRWSWSSVRSTMSRCFRSRQRSSARRRNLPYRRTEWMIERHAGHPSGLLVTSLPSSGRRPINVLVSSSFSYTFSSCITSSKVDIA